MEVCGVKLIDLPFLQLTSSEASWDRNELGLVAPPTVLARAVEVVEYALTAAHVLEQMTLRFAHALFSKGGDWDASLIERVRRQAI